MAHAAPRARPGILPALALLAGVALATQPLLPAGFVAWLACVLLIAGLGVRRRCMGLATALFGASMFLAGFWLECRAQAAHRAAIESLFPERLRARELSFVGELLGPPSVDWEGERWLRIRGAPERDAAVRRASHVIRLRIRTRSNAGPTELDGLESGDRVRVWCRLRRPQARSAPGRQEPSRALRSAGLHALGSVKSDRLVELLSRADRLRPIDSIRRTVQARLDFVLRDDRPARALAGAMLLGDRGRLDPLQRRVLRDAGLLHLVAISGLHVGLLVMAVLCALGRMRLGRWMRLLLVLCLLVGFTAGVGSRSSVVRAAIGSGTLLFGRCLGREGDPLNGLALLAAALVAYRPASLYDPGFQLTFLATAGILVLAAPIARALPLGGPLAGSLAVSMSAYLVTAPVVALHFRWVAPVGLLSNLVAVPLCAAVLLSGYAAVLLFPVPLLCDLTAWLARHTVHALLGVGALAADWDRGAFCVATPPALLLGAYYALLAVTAICGRRCGPSVCRATTRGLLSLALAWFHLGPPPGTGEGRLVAAVIDVGQGLAVTLQGPYGTPVLVDAGGSADRRFDPGERIVVPYLVDTSGPRLAALIVTHDHVDHIGGAFAVLRELEVGELWLGAGSRHSARSTALAELARERGTAVVLAEAGMVGDLDGIPLRILAPDRGSATHGNDRSVVVLAGSEPSRLLVPGDLENPGEEALLASETALRAEALVLTHHGSRHGSSLQFLRRVGPDWALVSAGRGNPFGHPHPDVVERLEFLGVPLLRTDELGSIRLRSVSDGWLPLATSR